MASLRIFFLIILLTISAVSATSSENCAARCRTGDFDIRFPFVLKDCQDSHYDGYPNFELSCRNDTQVTVTFPFSGDFNVQYIDYLNQAIYINDPDNCLPKRLMQQLNLSGSPFRSPKTTSFTFVNCSSSIQILPPLRLIPCLSGRDHSVVAAPTMMHDDGLSSSCSEVSVVTIPAWWNEWNFPTGVSEIVRLEWDESNSYGVAGDSNNGLPRGAKCVITLGAGLICLTLLITVACYSCNKIKLSHGRHRTSEFSSGLRLNHTTLKMGLDRPTIESYPKTQLGESGRLPSANDGTCAICLSEYKPKETLITLPECNHYFHAHCIEQWINLRAICPLCRNTPDLLSPGHTPSSA